MLLADGSLFPSVEAELEQVKATVPASQLDKTLSELRVNIEKHVAVAVEKVGSFFAEEIKKMLDAPVRLAPVEGGADEEEGEGGEEEEEEPEEELVPAPGALSTRFWLERGRQLVRSVFGTSSAVPLRAVERNQQVVEQPIIALGQYPGFTSAVAEIVRAECAARRGLVERAAAAVMDEITTAVSQLFYVEPSPDLLTVTIHPVYPSSGHGRAHRPRPGGLFTDALKVAFIRHLPNAERLKSVVDERAELKLSSFEEELGAQRKRGEIDQRLARVRMAVRGLVRALDVDESVPLDDAWLMALQAEHGLSADASVLYTTEELATALAKFETFHKLEPGRATAEQLQRSSAQIGGWLKASLPALEAKAAAAATSVQSAARRRAAINVKGVLKAEKRRGNLD